MAIASATVEIKTDNISLRPESDEDQQFMRALYASTRLTELELVPWNEHQKQAFVKMQFDARQQQYRDAYRGAVSSIILQESAPIGAMLVDERERETVLVDIALLPEHRNAGLGTQLVRALMDEAAGSGKVVRLHVLGTSAAVRFYERLGFSKTSDDGTYLEMTWRPAH